MINSNAYIMQRGSTMRRSRRRKLTSRRGKKRALMRIMLAMLALVLAVTALGSRHMLALTLELLGYPDSLIEKLENYPEARGYVLAYPFRAGEPDEVDVSADITPGEIPLFIQWDARWGYARYGSDMMGINACGPTSLSMVCCGLTGQAKWNPLEVSRMAERSGYYVPGTGSSWALMEDGARQLGLDSWRVALNSEAVLDELRAGHPVICSMRPGDFTYTGHFIVLTSADAQGNVNINDPNSPSKSAQTWHIERIMPQVKMAWAYVER